jgi:hypothetical protein
MLALARPTLALALASVLWGCSSSSAEDETHTGALVGGTGPLPGFIVGLHYRAGSHSGFTDDSGTFRYQAGDSVVFSLGDLQFEPAKGRGKLSPFQLANGAGCAVGASLTTVLQLLESADEDGDPTNGIRLPEITASGAPRQVSALAPGELDAALQAVRPGASLVAPDVALDRFIRQVDDEAWTEGTGDTFEFPDVVKRGQGVATDGESWFFSSTNHLQRTDPSFEAVVDNAVPLPKNIAQLGGNHIGDIDVFDGRLYAPIEDGPDYQNPYIVTYDSTTLEPTGDQFLLPQALLTEGVPWVAVDGPRRRVYAAEWDPTERIEMFDLDNGLAHLSALELDTPIGRIQGAKVFGGAMYASSDNDDKSIYKIDLDTGTVIKLFALGTANSEVEGLAPVQQADGAHLRILNVVIPTVVFSNYQRTRDPLRDAICP